MAMLSFEKLMPLTIDHDFNRINLYAFIVFGAMMLMLIETPFSIPHLTDTWFDIVLLGYRLAPQL